MNTKLLILSLILLLLPLRGLTHGRHPYGVKAIYQFGDSLSDTGNLIYDVSHSSKPQSTYARLPYGQTFFRHPTGRCSDGLLMVDYFAKYFKLPFLEPYLKKDGDFTHGVNFAVAGSTALDASTLASRNISVSNTNNPLSMQLNWFRSHLNSICNNPSDCKDKLQNALFLMGEIGGNDVSSAMFQKKSMEDVHKLVHEVVQTIKNAVKEVIGLGAIRVVVPGNFPIGCMPIYLVSFKTDDPTMYDELKCLDSLNDFAKFQNDQLQEVVRGLQEEYPHVAIVYGDYFYVLRDVLRSASTLGFDKDSTRKACCGSGDNTYNFDRTRMCGKQGVPVCRNPRAYVSWDGIHLTSHAYLHMAKSLLKQIAHGISHVEASSGYQQKNFLKLRIISPLFFLLLISIQDLFLKEFM